MQKDKRLYTAYYYYDGTKSIILSMHDDDDDDGIITISEEKEKNIYPGKWRLISTFNTVEQQYIILLK